MIQLLLQIDKVVFNITSYFPHTRFFDVFFSFLSGIGSWGMIWLIIGVAIFIWEEIKDKRGLLSLFTALIISVMVVEIILKNLVKRARPPVSVSELIVLPDIFESFSFPSWHATVSFAAAYILTKKHKKWAPLYYLLAVLISFSRIYLGKHYPSDVIAGAILGILIGYFSIKIVNRLCK